MKGYATEEKQEDKDAAWTHGGISLLGESLTMGCVQCFFCEGTSRYGVPENLTTG